MKIDKVLSFKFQLTGLFAMIMVIYIHSYNLDNILLNIRTQNGYWSNYFIQNLISQGIARIAVPLFFMISGFFFFKTFKYENYLKVLNKKVNTLFVPYIFWASIYVLLYYIIQLFPPSHVFFSNSLVKDYSTSELILNTFIYPRNYPLWFLRDLILLVCISPLILFLIKYFKTIFLFILGVTWFVIGEKNSDALLFFALGGYFAIYLEEYLIYRIKRKNYLRLLIFYIFLIFLNVFSPLFNLQETLTLFLSKLSIIVGVILFWDTLDRIYLKFNLDKLRKYTKYTFILYVFHEPILSILIKGGLSVFEVNPYISLILYLFVPILTIGCLMIFSNYLEALTPNIYRIITGGRIRNNEKKSKE